MDLDLAERFLTRVWERQPGHEQATHFMAHKDWETGDWNNKSMGGLNPIAHVLADWECDVYFAPCVFDRRKRQREHAIPGRWLYADLDEVDPANIELAPTLAWETSPGRFQALWLLDRAPKSVDLFEDLNRRLTYTVGADLGGWSTTKVLRVPGTVSTKYGRSRKKRFVVELVGKGGRYSLEELQRRLPQVDENGGGSHGGVAVDLAQLPDRKETLSKWRPRLPNRARTLLGRRHTVVGDDRSARLWELYALLLQAGMHPAEVLVAVQGTVWNKYAGQRRELAQLQKEISKAAVKHAQPGELDRVRPGKGRSKKLLGATARKVAKRQQEQEQQGKKMMPYLMAEEFMTHEWPEPEWLVEGIWTKGAYGIWGGVYKGYKTTALLDLIVSVGSGTPFLGRFAVHDPGRVTYIHEEGRQGQIKDRLHRIMTAKGLAATVTTNGSAGQTVLGQWKLPDFDVVSYAGIKLDDEDSQRELVRYLEHRRPKLVIMESWYLMAGEVDENKAREVEPVLEWLGTVAREFDCAIVVSHHQHKPQDDSRKRSMDRLSGTGVFGRWFESAVFMERKGEEEDHKVTFEAVHRAQKGSGKIEMQFEMDTEDEDSYQVDFIDAGVSDFKPKDPGEVEVELLAELGPKQEEMLGWLGSHFAEGGGPVGVSKLGKQFGVQYRGTMEALAVGHYKVGVKKAGAGGKSARIVLVPPELERRRKNK